MKLRVHPSLLPPGMAVGAVLAILLTAQPSMLATPGSSGTALHYTRLFALGSLVLSSALLATVFTIPLRSGALALLPGIQCFLLRRYFMLAAGIALVLGGVLHLALPMLPWPIASLLVLAFFSAQLLDRGTRNPLVLIASMLAPVAGIFLCLTAGPARFLGSHPWWGGGACLGVVALAAHRGSRRQSLRGLVMRVPPNRTPGKASDRDSANPARAVRSGFASNFQLIFPRMSLRSELLTSAAVMVTLMFISAIVRDVTGRNTVTLFATGLTREVSFIPMFSLFMAGMGPVSRQKPGPFVPIPRRRMANLSMVSTVIYMGAVTILFIALSIANDLWTASRLGQTVATVAIDRFAIANTVWLIGAPLLNPRIADDTQANALLRGGFAVLVLVLQSTMFHWGLATAAMLSASCILASHLGFYFVLRRRYTRADLVDRGADNPLIGWRVPRAAR